MKLQVNGKSYTKFEKYEIDLTFNAVASSFSFTAQSSFIDELIYYTVCEIRNDDNQLLIRGNTLPPTLKSSASPETVTINGYSSAGMMEDCQIPIESYPLQYDGLNLSEITNKIISGFFFEFSYSENVREDMLKIYDKIEAKPDQTIKDFLTQLASQRNIILSHHPDGKLYFTRLDATGLKPVDKFEIGTHGIKKMTLQIDGQSLHSSITVLGQASESEDGDSSQATLDNPYLIGLRPKVVVIDAGDEFDAEKSVRNELGKELGAIKLTFETTKFNFPGQIVLIKNEDLKLNKFTEFFIENVKIKGSSDDEDNYTYTCVLKDVYTSDKVINVFN